MRPNVAMITKATNEALKHKMITEFYKDMSIPDELKTLFKDALTACSVDGGMTEEALQLMGNMFKITFATGAIAGKEAMIESAFEKMEDIMKQVKKGKE